MQHEIIYVHNVGEEINQRHRYTYLWNVAPDNLDGIWWDGGHSKPYVSQTQSQLRCALVRPKGATESLRRPNPPKKQQSRLHGSFSRRSTNPILSLVLALPQRIIAILCQFDSHSAWRHSFDPWRQHLDLSEPSVDMISCNHTLLEEQGHWYRRD